MIFTYSWLEKNKENHLVLKIMKTLEPIKITNGKNQTFLNENEVTFATLKDKIIIYNVPLLWLTIIDILTYLCFYPSVRVLERNISESHTPNVQTINGV